MKPKRPERVERRRPLVEMNLLSERTKGRLAGRRRGCINPFAFLVLVLAAVLADWFGLH
jgi:hypothetical protein